MEDAPAVAGLSAELGYPVSIANCAERLGAILASGENGVFVACSADGSIVAWVHVFKALRMGTQAFAEIGGLIVSAEHRRRGIGRRLLAATEKWAARRGMAKLRVRPRSSRSDANRFYKRAGFSKSKEQLVLDKALR